MTALHLAVLAKNLEAVRVLSKETICGPTVYDHERRTPLHYAALHGRVEEIELLLECGADVNTRDAQMATPAHYAAQKSLPALKILLKNNKQDVLDGKDNRSTFMWAVAAQNVEVVNAFLNNELGVPCLPNQTDRRKQTALHLAALQGNIEICKKLQGAGWKETVSFQSLLSTYITLSRLSINRPRLQFILQREMDITS
jgi:ankyrin repeat protein